MSTLAPEQDLAELDVSNLELWRDGPPHEVFRRLRNGARAALERDRRLPRRGRLLVGGPLRRHHAPSAGPRDLLLRPQHHPRRQARAEPGDPDPMDIAANMMITQDPPRHDRLKALVQRAFTPKRALDHTERMREIINLVWDRALEAPPRRPARPGPRRWHLRPGDGHRRHARRAARGRRASSSTGPTAPPRSRTRASCPTWAMSGGRWRSSFPTSTRWSRSASPNRPRTSPRRSSRPRSMATGSRTRRC